MKERVTDFSGTFSMLRKCFTSVYIKIGLWIRCHTFWCFEFIFFDYATAGVMEVIRYNFKQVGSL